MLTVPFPHTVVSSIAWWPKESMKDPTYEPVDELTVRGGLAACADQPATRGYATVTTMRA